MRVFVTGATGFIGSAVVRELIGAGHSVTGLARTDAAARAITAAGAAAHRGSLEDLASLRSGAAAADGVIHLAFMHGFSQASLGARLRVLLGGAPGGIVKRFMATIASADRAAIDAMGAALEHSGRPLVAAFGTMGLAPGGGMTEADAPDPRSPGVVRAMTETAVQAWGARGVRAIVARLPPSVHGDGDTGLLPQLAAAARKKGRVGYVGDGLNRWSAVHRDDAAVLFRLALEKGAAGARYHAVADEGVRFRDIAALMGRRLGLPAESVTQAEAARAFSWLAPFVSADNPATSYFTREQLGWVPVGPGLMADIDRVGYFKG